MRCACVQDQPFSGVQAAGESKNVFSLFDKPMYSTSCSTNRYVNMNLPRNCFVSCWLFLTIYCNSFPFENKLLFLHKRNSAFSDRWLNITARSGLTPLVDYLKYLSNRRRPQYCMICLQLLSFKSCLFVIRRLNDLSFIFSLSCAGKPMLFRDYHGLNCGLGLHPLLHMSMNFASYTRPQRTSFCDEVSTVL
jgi:hypothetical protein